MLLVKSFFIGTEGIKSYRFSKTEVINFCLHLKNSVFSTREVQYLLVKYDVHSRYVLIDRSQTSRRNAHCVLKKESVRKVFANCGLNLGYSIYYSCTGRHRKYRKCTNQRSSQNLKKHTLALFAN